MPTLNGGSAFSSVRPGRGIMTQAVKAVAPYVMSRFGLVRLEAPVFAWNPASMRVLEKCGFAKEGVSRASVFKDGDLVDQVLYALVVPEGIHGQPLSVIRERTQPNA